jgi:hypothetical protein
MGLFNTKRCLAIEERPSRHLSAEEKDETAIASDSPVRFGFLTPPRLSRNDGWKPLARHWTHGESGWVVHTTYLERLRRHGHLPESNIQNHGYSHADCGLTPTELGLQRRTHVSSGSFRCTERTPAQPITASQAIMVSTDESCGPAWLPRGA